MLHKTVKAMDFRHYNFETVLKLPHLKLISISPVLFTSSISFHDWTTSFFARTNPARELPWQRAWKDFTCIGGIVRRYRLLGLFASFVPVISPRVMIVIASFSLKARCVHAFPHYCCRIYNGHKTIGPRAFLQTDMPLCC